MKRHTLTKSERLCSESRMEALFCKGRRGNVGPLRFCFLVSGGVGSGGGESGGVAEEAPASVLFSVPKKTFKKAWMRNLIKRRMRESYRCRKHALADAVLAAGRHIDIALICSPASIKSIGGARDTRGVKNVKAGAVSPEIPDFATIDNAIAKILDKILARS